MALLPALKSLGVKIIGVGGNPGSVLARESAVWIDASIAQEACPHNLAPTTSTTLALAVGDALAVTVMRARGFDADAFARNHPGGALGRRLNLKIGDVMVRGKAVPVVGPEANMDEVVVINTEKRLGAVLVVQGKVLLANYDGALPCVKHRERFFDSAQDVMTRSPTTVLPEMLVAEALAVMENRPARQCPAGG